MQIGCTYQVHSSILIASQQKAQHHVFAHSSTRTVRRKESVNILTLLSIGNQTYNFAIFITGIYNLRHRKNTRDGRYLDSRLTTGGLNMH
jgi:hypothetical protein